LLLRHFNWRNSQQRALITTKHRQPLQKRAGHPGTDMDSHFSCISSRRSASAEAPQVSRVRDGTLDGEQAGFPVQENLTLRQSNHPSTESCRSDVSIVVDPELFGSVVPELTVSLDSDEVFDHEILVSDPWDVALSDNGEPGVAQTYPHDRLIAGMTGELNFGNGCCESAWRSSADVGKLRFRDEALAHGGLQCGDDVFVIQTPHALEQSVGRRNQ
jgi:hypothetical protein